MLEAYHARVELMMDEFRTAMQTMGNVLRVEAECRAFWLPHAPTTLLGLVAQMCEESTYLCDLLSIVVVVVRTRWLDELCARVCVCVCVFVYG